MRVEMIVDPPAIGVGQCERAFGILPRSAFKSPCG